MNPKVARGALQIAAIIVIGFVLSTAAALWSADFPKHAFQSVRSDYSSAFKIGEAGFFLLQLLIQLSAALLALLQVARPSLMGIKLLAVSAALLAVVVSALDIYLLPILSIIQNTAFLLFEWKAPRPHRAT